MFKGDRMVTKSAVFLGGVLGGSWEMAPSLTEPKSPLSL